MKRFLTLLSLVVFGLLATPHSQAQINPYAMGIGLDIEGSFGAYNVGIPIEFRLGRTTDPFTLHLGLRTSFHNGGDDSAAYFDPHYGIWLYEPTVSFVQFSPYIAGRWNFYQGSDFTAFAGAGYYLNFNTNARINMDIPNVSLIGGSYVYTLHDGRRRFHCDDMINRTSHSLRLEVGAHMPVLEFTVFLSFDLTHNFKRKVVDNNVYYDQTCIDRHVYTFQPAVGYVPINLASLEDIDDATHDVVFFGCGLKFFLFSGYLKH